MAQKRFGKPRRAAASNGRHVSIKVVAAAASVALAVTACSSSSSGSSSGTTPGSSSTGGNSAAGGSSAAPAKGGSVKLMVEGAISGSVLAFPELVTGAQVAIDRLNKAGGVNGHQLTLVTCDDKGNPNLAANCGRQAVSEKVAAVVGNLSLYDSNFFPSLQAAHIAAIASTAITTIDHTSPISFPINSSVIDYSGEGVMLAKAGCTDLAVLGIDQPGTSAGVGFIQAAFKKTGGAKSQTYLFPPSTSDFTSFVATATSKGAKCIAFIGSGPGQLAGAMQAVKKSGSKTLMSAAISLVLPQVLAPVAFPAGQLLVAGAFYAPDSGTASAAVDQYVADMKASGKSGQAAGLDTVSENSYQAVLMYALAAKGLDDQTSTAVLAKVNQLTNVDTGLTPPFDLDKPGLFSGFPQDRYNNVVSYTWTGSGLHYQSKFTVSP